MKTENTSRAIVLAGAYDPEFAAWLEHNEQKRKKATYLHLLLNGILRGNRQPSFLGNKHRPDFRP